MDVNLSPEQIRTLAEQIAQHGIPPDWKAWLIFLLLVFLATAAAAWLGAYFGKVAAISAVSSTLNKVLAQTQAITKTTGVINSNLARLDWAEQRSWELKQKFYWDLLVHANAAAHSWAFAEVFWDEAQAEKAKGNVAGADDWLSRSNEEALAAGEHVDAITDLYAVAGVLAISPMVEKLEEYRTRAAERGDEPIGQFYGHLSKAALALHSAAEKFARSDLQIAVHPEQATTETNPSVTS